MAAPHTIAVAGKGGVGKTTTCGMIVEYLCRQKKGPILVVDADANSNLNEVLGVEADVTLGQIREEMAHAEQTCYVNGVLKTQVDKYAKNYSYVVMDNEAGLEHVARGTLPKVDTMLLVSDCSRRGIQAVARIAEMIDEMQLNPGQMGLIVNRAPGGVLDKGVQEEIDRHGLKLFGVLPQDDGVYRCDCNGEPSAKLPDSSPMKTAVNRLMEQLGL